MFEVLTFVYQNYDAGPAYPETGLLERRLSSVGFAADEIDDALTWLQGLDSAAQPARPSPWLIQPRADSVRIYPPHEQIHLGTQAIGFLSFMDGAGLLAPDIREVIIDRAMAAPGGPIALEDLKVIVLMVYWRFGQEPDVLVLDELCNDALVRVAH